MQSAISYDVARTLMEERRRNAMSPEARARRHVADSHLQRTWLVHRAAQHLTVRWTRSLNRFREPIGSPPDRAGGQSSPG